MSDRTTPMTQKRFNEIRALNPDGVAGELLAELTRLREGVYALITDANADHVDALAAHREASELLAELASERRALQNQITDTAETRHAHDIPAIVDVDDLVDVLGGW